MSRIRSRKLTDTLPAAPHASTKAPGSGCSVSDDPKPVVRLPVALRGHHERRAFAFADLVHGAKVIEASLHALLALDLEQTADAALAMEELGRMHAWLFTDMLPHVKEIEEGWQALEDQVVRRLPPDPDDD